METCLEMWESYKTGAYQPKWKGKMACLLCAAILGGSAYVAGTAKPEKYLGAKEKTTVMINQNGLIESVAQKKAMKVVSLENGLQNRLKEAESKPERILETMLKTDNISKNLENTVEKISVTSSNTIAVGHIETTENRKIEEISRNTTEEIKDSKSEEVDGNVIKEIKDSKSEKADENVIEEIKESESEKAGGDMLEEIKNSESEKINETDTEVTSPFLIDEEGMLYGIRADELDYSTGVLELPTENCIGIRSNAFSSGITGIYEVSIPTNISVIETGAFSELPDLFDITVEDGNVNYSSIDGVLYGEQGTALLAFPAGRTGGYIVPTQTRRIVTGAFYHTGLSVIDIRDCGELEIEDGEAMQFVR